jgi:hypothetical protein
MVLSAIVELRLDGNSIRVIPPGICRLKRLQELSMVRTGGSLLALSCKGQSLLLEPPMALWPRLHD